MFEDLAKRLEARLFGSPEGGEASTALAVAVIVAAIGHAGPTRQPLDAASITGVLGELLGTERDAAAPLAGEAQALAGDAALALFPYTHAYRGAADYGRRLALIRALWRLVLARGDDRHEGAYVDEVASLLGLSREACVAERWRVQHPG